MSSNATEPLSVRPMQARDIGPARDLWSATEGVGLSEGDLVPSLALFLERNPGLSVVVETADGGLVGAMLCGHDGRRGFLYHLAIVPSFRGRGLARLLIDHALHGLAAAGIQKCSIMVYAHNESGLQFWRHLGWHGRPDLAVQQHATI